MTYMSRNPQLASVVLDDITTTTPGNPPSGKHKLVDRNGTMFIRDASGAEVALGTTASVGSGEKNYISNPSGAAATTGWATYGDLLLTRTTTASELPREETTKTGLKIVADANTQGTGDIVYFNFTLDDVDLGRQMKVKFDVKKLATYDGKLQAYIATAADVATQVAGGAVAPAINTSTVTVIPAADGTFTVYFFSGSTAALSLVIQANADMTTGDGVTISDVVVGPNVQVQGAAIGAWKSYTPTGSFNSNVTYTGRYREVGDSVEVQIDIAFSGATNATALSMTQAQIFNGIGYTVATTKIPQTSDMSMPVGSWGGLDSGTQGSYGGHVSWDGSTFFLGWMSGASTAVGVTNTAPFTWNTGDNIGIKASIPVNELSANTVLATRAVEEYVSHDGSSVIKGVDGATIPTTTPSGSNETLDISSGFSTIQSTDKFFLEVRYPNGSWVNLNTEIDPYRFDGTNGIGATVVGGSTSGSVQILRGKYRQGVTAQAWSTMTSGMRWRVRKVSGGASVGYPISSANIVGRTDGVAPAAGMVGELIGTVRTGTGGLTYSTRTTTATTSTPASIISVTLNKGVYLLSYSVNGYASASTIDAITHYIRIGGTQVTNSEVTTWANSNRLSTGRSGIPILISADSTVVDLYGSAAGAGTITAPLNEMWVVRIA